LNGGEIVSVATPNALGATATTGGTYRSVKPNRPLLANTTQRTPTESFFALGAAIDPRGSGTIPRVPSSMWLAHSTKSPREPTAPS